MSPVSLKRVTHSDGYGFAADCVDPSTQKPSLDLCRLSAYPHRTSCEPSHLSMKVGADYAIC